MVYNHYLRGREVGTHLAHDQEIGCSSHPPVTMDRDAELIDIIIVFGGIGIFLYYFFFVPPTVTIVTFPVYHVRLEYSAVIFVAPMVVTSWLMMMLITDCGKKRIRDYKIKQKLGILAMDICIKLSDGIKEYRSWRERNRKH